MTAGQHPGFRDFLRGLPDAIQRARDDGHPIRVTLPADPPEHVRALMATLGVTVNEDPTLPRPRSWNEWTAEERDELLDRLKEHAA